MILLTKVSIKELPLLEKSIEELLQMLPKNVQNIAMHTSKAGGKRIRPLLTLLSAQIFGKADKNIYPLCSCLELLHLASLLHDDVIDNADKRRNKPTAHTLYGKAQTILSGDALLAHSNAIIASYGDADLMQSFSSALIKTASAAFEEIEIAGNIDQGVEKYYEIILGKTAYLISTSCRMGALYAKNILKKSVTDEEVEALSLYGKELGLAFQLIDDALDFAPQEQTGKPQGGDIREAKATIPILAYYDFLVASDSQRAEEFKRKFMQTKTEIAFTQDEIDNICKEIRSHKFDELARSKAREHILNAKNHLEKLPQGSVRNIFIQLADYLDKRDH